MAGAHQALRGEIRGLTGLRLVAAVWVVAHHFWLFSPDRDLLARLDPLRPLLASGWLGVDLFFVLSGFVLAHNYVAVLGNRFRGRAAVDFYRARISRIWPTWMVVLGAVLVGGHVQQALVGTPGGSAAEGLDAVTLLRQVLLVQVWDRPDYSATGPVGPGWSLSAEWLAYLAFPLLALLLHRVRSRRPVVPAALAVAALVPFAATCLVLGTHDWAWSWLLRLTGAFLAGSLAALAVARVDRGAAVERAAGRTAAAVLALLPVALWWAGAAGQDRAGAVALLFPVLVGALALTDAGPARLLSTPLVVLGGRISFALYLVHMAVFETLWTLAGAGSASAAGVLLQLGAPFLAAWVLWRFVEEPARRRLRGAPARRSAVPVPVAVPEPRAAAADAPVTSMA
ncbi:acyltransferase [Blastococcus sp. BMG 814]|uniref:Acyltransferase n=1 Tax=Blastococcus carthaginiensis TaxID=3050034 RepID=A0ABT9IB91_9ACTN|nr:acyltransferase [Blastococcus carthaginiensis]MDP5182835.1 acyltransferase [Blastococcus carthaginiensis]